MMWEYQCGCIVMLCQLVEDCQVCTPTLTHCELVYVCVYLCLVLQESSSCYWAGEEGEEMVCGRLRVRLLKVSAMGDIVERKFGITAQHFTDTLIVKMIQLASWQLQGLPHPSAIMALVVKLNNALMSSSSKQTVVMCRSVIYQWNPSKKTPLIRGHLSKLDIFLHALACTTTPEMKALKCKTLGGIHIHHALSHIEQQVPRTQYGVYTARARTSASLPRVGPRLYLACFTPVAPVASL